MHDPEELAFLDVASIATGFRSGRFTPLQFAEASLKRLEALDSKLNAFIEPMRASVLAAAKVATDELAEGRDRGLLHGVPVAIKDIIDVAGVPTTYATRAVPPAVPDHDAELVRRLRDAGAVIFGKTNLLEFAYGIPHPAIGQTNNPHDFGRTSGGSSGGSVAAVAAGIVPLAVGTDTGGSIRIPAAYCGIVGLKPTYDLVSTEGVFPLSWSLDHAGPLARSVADATALLAGLVGRSFAVSARPIQSLRIGVVGGHMSSPHVTPGVHAAVTNALDRLRAAGATIENVEIAELDGANPGLMMIVLAEARVVHERIVAENPGGYAPRTREQIEAGAHAAAADYIRAQRLRQRLTVAVEAMFQTFDIIVSPAVAWVAPVEDPEMSGDDGGGELLSSGIANMTGHPALNLPCGLSDGLPVGLQLIGARGRDAELLAHAAAVEALLGPIARPAIPR